MLEAMADPEIPFIGYESEQDWFHALCILLAPEELALRRY